MQNQQSHLDQQDMLQFKQEMIDQEKRKLELVYEWKRAKNNQYKQHSHTQTQQDNREIHESQLLKQQQSEEALRKWSRQKSQIHQQESKLKANNDQLTINTAKLQSANRIVREIDSKKEYRDWMVQKKLEAEYEIIRKILRHQFKLEEKELKIRKAELTFDAWKSKLHHPSKAKFCQLNEWNFDSMNADF